MTRLQADGLLVLVALIWGTAFVAQHHGMADVGPMLFTGVRFLIGAAVVAPLALREWRGLARQGRQPGRGDLGHIAALGVLMLAGAAMQQVGIVSTSVTNAGFLTALYVPLVPVLGWLLLAQRPHWSAWPAALGCVGGAYLLAGAHLDAVNVGDAWVAASALPWAVHVLLVGRWAERMAAPFVVACGQFVVCGLGALAWALVAEPVHLASLAAAALPIAYTGVLSVGVAFTAQVVAQRRAPAADAAIILSVETVFAALFGAWLLGERLDGRGLAGCGLILLCIVAVQLVPLLRRTAR
ncbi:EamA/RhaT family transporter [Pelomonas sp. HMWF004]|nr:EamA/RhaT family transporter [Pelomonas sp. HMWF004]